METASSRGEGFDAALVGWGSAVSRAIAANARSGAPLRSVQQAARAAQGVIGGSRTEGRRSDVGVGAKQTSKTMVRVVAPARTKLATNAASASRLTAAAIGARVGAARARTVRPWVDDAATLAARALGQRVAQRSAATPRVVPAPVVVGAPRSEPPKPRRFPSDFILYTLPLPSSGFIGFVFPSDFVANRSSHTPKRCVVAFVRW